MIFQYPKENLSPQLLTTNEDLNLSKLNDSSAMMRSNVKGYPINTIATTANNIYSFNPAESQNQRQ